MDFLEWLKESADGYIAVFVILCTFSNFVMWFPTKDKTSGEGLSPFWGPTGLPSPNWWLTHAPSAPA